MESSCKGNSTDQVSHHVWEGKKKNGTQKIDPEKLERKRAAEDQKSTLLKNNPLLYCPIHLLKKQKNPYCSQM